MRLTPLGGIMDVVADPLEKDASWQGGGTSMSAEDKNKALVRRFLGERIKGNLKAVNEMLAPDFVDFVERSLLPDQELNREEYKRSMVDIATAFSIGDWTIEDQIAEGDKVMTRWTARCVHNRGQFMGVAPTG